MEISIQNITTPLGVLQISLQAMSDHDEVEAIADGIQVFSFSPVIPSGMAVAGCTVAIATISPKKTLRNLLFSAKLMTSEAVESAPETGEGLDALSFRNTTHVLLVGTEDTEALISRLKSTVKLPEIPFPFAEDSIAIEILESLEGEKLSLHFIAAWNSLPEPQDCSCWYAVDQSHSVLLSALETQQSSHSPTTQ